MDPRYVESLGQSDNVALPEDWMVEQCVKIEKDLNQIYNDFTGF